MPRSRFLNPASLMLIMAISLSPALGADDPLLAGDNAIGLRLENQPAAEKSTGVTRDSSVVSNNASAADRNALKNRFVSKNPTGAALRSLLVPGWGQLYTGHWIKALVYFGTDAGMIYGILRQDARYMDYLTQAKEQKTDRLRSEYERVASFYRDDRNRLIWWTAGWTLLATFDAFVEAHLYGFHIDPTLGVTPQGDGLKLGISVNGP